MNDLTYFDLSSDFVNYNQVQTYIHNTLLPRKAVLTKRFNELALNALVNLNRLRVDQGGPEYTEASIEEADTEALIEELEKLD
jgi:hypothetical protein